MYRVLVAKKAPQAATRKRARGGMNKLVIPLSWCNIRL